MANMNIVFRCILIVALSIFTQAASVANEGDFSKRFHEHGYDEFVLDDRYIYATDNQIIQKGHIRHIGANRNGILS